MILSGSASQSVAIALGEHIDETVAPVRYERFPDGELMTSVDVDAPLSINGRAIVVASTSSARAHIEVLQLQDIAVEAGADEIVTVIPYLGYARQEIAHHPGQPASARAIAGALSATTDRVITVDPHEPLVADYFEVPCTITSAVSSLADAVPSDLEDPVFLAPDEGAKDLAVTVADTYGRGRADHLEKTRISGDEVDISAAESNISGSEVIIIDDIVATGSTIATAARMLGQAEVGAVHVACVHPLFVGSAYSRLKAAGVESIVATDTIERPVSTVSAASAIADALE